MRPPEFWQHKYGREAAPFSRTLLMPFGKIYAWAVSRRIAKTEPYDPGIPVICVGNATLGGTGKTPIAAAIMQRAQKKGLRTAILSRGYKGREKGPIPVTPAHSAADVGDEPAMLARLGEVWIAAGRDDGARTAAAYGVRLLVMDDGHQNPLVKKTLSLLVVDAEMGFGNGYVVPAGPLREPSERALARADAVILMAPYHGFQISDALKAELEGLPQIRAFLAPTHSAPPGPLLAFAGIGRPNKFFDALRREGGDVKDGIAFADHHKFKTEDILSLFDMAEEYGAQLITTEKDYVRLPQQFQPRILCWPVTAKFENEEILVRLIDPIIEAAR